MTRKVVNDAVAYLQSIVDGLKDGSLRFVDGEEPLVLEPGAEVEVEVEAVDKGGKQKLEIEISWGGPDEAGDDDEEE